MRGWKYVYAPDGRPRTLKWPWSKPDTTPDTQPDPNPGGTPDVRPGSGADGAPE